MSKLREDILFKLTGDSYGEELYVDNKAKFIADDMLEVFKKTMLEIIGEDENPAGTRMIGVPSVQRDLFRKELRQKINEL